MIITDNGKICDGFYVTGSPITPVYLLDGPQPVLFDGGFTALANQYEAGIREILKDRTPAYLFLTHSHFDHIGAVGRIKKAWPDIRIGGSERCHEILSNQRAIKLISALSLEGTKSIRKLGIRPLNEDPFEPFDLDLQIKAGQKIMLSPDLSLVALNTPGHTWDFMSYWIPERKILIASEAVAVFENKGYIQPEFLVDVDAYLESLEKIKALDATVLCAGHYTVFTGRDAADHVRNSIKVTREYLKRTEEFLDGEGGDIERVVSRIKVEDWDVRPWPKQPESAYLINTRQRVKIIWERMNTKTD